MTNLVRLLEGHSPAFAVDPEMIADRVRASNRVFIVLDDDPTGTQSVADVPVLARWRVEDIEWAINVGASAVYILTNTRSFDPETASRINREVVTAAVQAGHSCGVQVTFVSRSDSTLRGHFPLETDVIAETLVNLGQPRPVGVVLVPAFPDAGRVTVDGVHFTLEHGSYVPVGESEFARDPTFGYRASLLADWVAEKSAGRISARSVVKITLYTLRAGADAVAAVLRNAPESTVFAADAVEEDDLRQLATGLEIVEAEGRDYIYRVGPPFVRSRIGQKQSTPLEVGDFSVADASPGGLVVVGSHVGLTSRQLAHLKQQRPDIAIVEIDVPSLLDADTARTVIDQAVDTVVARIDEGDVVIHSSRTLVRVEDRDESLAIARKVSDALVEIVQRTVEARRPRFVIAKGGITSSDIATRGLSIARARVRGSLFPGLVSVWEPADGRAVGVPYVVFAGNVGSDTSLTDAVEKLSAH